MSRAGGSLLCLSFSLLLSCPDVAAFAPSHTTAFGIVKKQTALHVIPPANSPYLQPSDEPNPLPSGYDPQLEYPGTMRPSKVRENSPFEDLPLLQTQDEAGDEQQPTLQSPEVEIGGCGVNVPWPHFQDIPYHLTWGAANEDTGPIDEFIGLQGRWMTEEEEEEVTRFSRPRNKGRVEAQVVVEDDEEDEEEEDDDSFEGGDFEVKDALLEEDKDEAGKEEEDVDADDEDDEDDLLDDDDDLEDDDDGDDEEEDLDDMLGF